MINLPIIEARTVSVTVLVIVGLYLVLVLEAAGRRVRAALVSTLCAVMLGLYGVVLALEGTRDFFELAVPNAGIILSAIGGSAFAIGGLWLTDDRFVPTLRRAQAEATAAGSMGLMTETAAIASLDARRLRADFPALALEIHGKPLAYLDSANSSQKPRQVLDAMREFYETSYANVHRAVYVLGERSTAGYEGAREKVRALLNARSTREIVFTRNGTEGLNLVAYAWGLDNLGPGDVAVATELEHHSNLVPWQYIAKRTGAEFAVIPIDSNGELVLEALAEIEKRGRVKLVACGARLEHARARSAPWRSSRPGRTSATRSWSSTRARLRRTGRSTCRRSAATSSPSRATRCSARAVSAASGGGRSCCSACRRSSSAAR